MARFRGIRLPAMTMTMVLALMSGCSRDEPTTPINAGTTSTNTPAGSQLAPIVDGPRVSQPPSPVGPSLCDRLTDPVVSEVMGFAMKASGGETDVSCVYVTTDPAHVGTVLSMTSSDAGSNLDQLLDSAKAGSSTFERLDGLGDAAYFAVVGDRPQAAVIIFGKQLVFSLSVAPPISTDEAKARLTGLLASLARPPDQG